MYSQHSPTNEQYYEKFLSRPIRFLVHKIVLQFCVFSVNLPPVLLVLFSHELLLVCVAQPCHGRDSLEVPAFCLGTCDLTLVWGSALPDGRLMEHLVLMGGLKYTACLAWSCTQSVCALPS
jgi:hypothetical protein